MRRRRPDLNHAIRALIEDAVRRLPEFSHIDPTRILVVAGEARRSSRGTVKPLAFAGGKSRDEHGNRKPIVKLNGRRMLYCITLRPLFFRDSDAAGRVGTLLHELFHISSAFDGTLEDRHRHERMGRVFARRLRPLVRRYLRTSPPELLAPFSYHGEVRIQQWLERPGAFFLPGAKSRRIYDQTHLFTASVRMLTPQPGKATKPRRVRLH